MTVPVFPCEVLPDDPGEAKLLGIYPQRQEGRWLQRIRIAAGRLTAAQWRALAAIAREHTPDTPLHLTTRQDIEIHDLAAGQVPAVQRALAEAGLTTLGAAGDTLRNVTVCPSAGTAPDKPDLADLAAEITRTLHGMEGIFHLPRKFKISLSAGADAAAQPYISDLGFIAEQRDGQWGFRVVGAGSLGAKPGLGVELFDWIPTDDVLPLVCAAVRVFDAEGDREHRTRARLRHARQRIGDAAFLIVLKDAFVESRADRDWPAVTLETPTVNLPARCVLNFPNGDITPAAAEALAGLVERDNVRVRLSNWHQVVVFGADGSHLAAAVRGEPALRAAADAPAVVACPGVRWCSRGLADTNAIADAIRQQLADRLPADAVVAVSGCPNGCSQYAVADIGLSGMRTTRDGEKQEAWNVTAGGGMGRDGRLSEPAGQKLDAAEALAAVKKIAKTLRG